MRFRNLLGFLLKFLCGYHFLAFSKNFYLQYLEHSKFILCHPQHFPVFPGMQRTPKIELTVFRGTF